MFVYVLHFTFHSASFSLSYMIHNVNKMEDKSLKNAHEIFVLFDLVFRLC